MPWNYRIPAKARPSNSSKYRTDSRSMQALTLSSSSHPKSKAGTGLSNHGFFFYSTRSWGTCKVSRILVNRKPPINTSARLRLTWPFFVLYDCFLLDANVMQSTDHGKSRKIRGPSNFSRYCNEMTSWQHSGIHTVLQLPSNLSCVGSSAPSAISCKGGSRAGTGLSNHGFFFKFCKKFEAHAKYPGFLSTETPQSILLPDYVRLTWPFFVLYDCFLLDANVMRSTDHGKSRKVNDLQTFQDTVMKWRLAAFRHSHCFATPIHSVLSWFLCAFSDILQIRHKSKAGTGLSNHGFLFYSTRSLRHMQSIQDACQPKPSNQRFCQIKTHLAVLCAVWLFSTWRKCDAVNRSWQIKKSKGTFKLFKIL